MRQKFAGRARETVDARDDARSAARGAREQQALRAPASALHQFERARLGSQDVRTEPDVRPPGWCRPDTDRSAPAVHVQQLQILRRGERHEQQRSEHPASATPRFPLGCVARISLSSPMKYRNVGHSGLQISAVSIGGWLTFGGSLDKETTRGILDAAIDAGINFVDLADVYSQGKAEKAAGKALARYPRHELVISSKVFGRMSDDVNDRGLSRKHIMESVEGSLERLRTEYLDIYFCHRADPSTPLEETVRAMDDLVHQGKILYWGTSVWSAGDLSKASELAEARNLFAPRVEQPQYSLLERDIEKDVLPTCAEHGIGVVTWSPLAGGALTGKYDDGVPEGSRAATTEWMKEYLSEQNLPKLREFSGLARDLGVEPGQLALAWILRRPEIASVITGATRPEHVASNVQAVDVEVSDELARQLDRLFPA
jgi:voltage-dependent potassium channel beta subunit